MTDLSTNHKRRSLPQKSLAEFTVAELPRERRNELPVAAQIGLTLLRKEILQQTLYPGSSLTEVLAAEVGLDPEDDNDITSVKRSVRILKQREILHFDRYEIEDTREGAEDGDEKTEITLSLIKPTLTPKVQHLYHMNAEEAQEKFSPN